MSQRIAIVTGGTSGIGAATTELLRADGWTVVPTGLTDEELDSAGPSARRLDVRDMDAVSALLGEFDRLDGLVNAAGVGAVAHQTEIDTFEFVLDVNLTGTMRCCHAAHGALAVAHGSIVNIASILAFVGNQHSPAYAASKAGVMNLTKALAARWAPDGVRVNAVAPGYVETPMTTHVREDNERTANVMSRTHMKRYGQPDEIGHLIAFLLSDKASFITGSTHVADGGYLAT